MKHGLIVTRIGSYILNMCFLLTQSMTVLEEYSILMLWRIVDDFIVASLIHLFPLRKWLK